MTNEPLLVSTTLRSLMLRLGTSSSTMLPAPWASATAALTAADRLTKNVSLNSSDRVAQDRDGDGLAGFAGCEGERAAGRGVIAAGDAGAVGRGVVHAHRLAARRRQGDGEDGATVPLLPSVTLTSLMVSAAVSSSMIVPAPWSSAMVAFTAPERLTVKDSFSSSTESPENRDGDGLAGLARCKGQRAADAGVVAAGHGAAVGGGVVHGHRLAARGDRVTVKVARSALGHADIVDAEGRGVVIDDGADADAVADGAFRRPRGESERLIELIDGIADTAT